MHKKKLLPTNTQNSHNSVYYKQIIADTKNFEKRGDEFTFNIAQSRTKFKRFHFVVRQPYILKLLLESNNARRTNNLDPVSKKSIWLLSKWIVTFHFYPSNHVSKVLMRTNFVVKKATVTIPLSNQTGSALFN